MEDKVPKISIRLLAAIAALLAGLSAGAAGAAEIKVVCAGAMRGVLQELAPAFEKSSGHKLVIEYATAGKVEEKVAADEAIDVAILTKPRGDKLVRVTDQSFVAAEIGVDQGTPIVTRCPLPAHAAALGDQLQVPVALRRRGLCRSAWHCARTWRHNDRRSRMTLADLTVDIVPIVRS